MPTCAKCGRRFDKVHRLGRPVRTGKPRKYCASCKPVGLTMHKETHGECTCTVCGRRYTYNRKKGHTRSKCGTCSCNQRRFDVKKRAVAYKGGKCKFCGYKRCMRALKFHHKDPAKKDFSIAGNHCRAWSVVVKELDKCVLVCSNCHDEIHEGLISLA